jgi:hypothetical protein
MKIVRGAGRSLVAPRRSLTAFVSDAALFPFLYAIMVWLEAPISGTSTNPARSLGPAGISGEWQGWWIYWLGPLIGAVSACGGGGVWLTRQTGAPCDAWQWIGLVRDAAGQRGSDVLGLLHPRRDVALAMQHAPHVDVVRALDV